MRTLALLPCLLAALLCAPAAARADVLASMFSSPSSCPGVPAGGVTAATDTTTAPTGWQGSDVTINLTGANVTGWEWMVDCGTVQSGLAGSSVVFNVNGSHVLSHRATDGSGWTAWSDDVIQVDKGAPQNNTTVPSGWSQTNVSVNVTGADAVSSVAQVEWDRGDGTGTHTGAPPVNLIFSGDGVYSLATRVQDAAGNWSAIKNDTVRIDGTAPIDDTVVPSGWQYTPTSVTVTGHDTGSGVGHVEWKLDGVLNSGGNGASVSIPDGSHSLQTRIVDGAGNASNWTSYTVQVDTTGPQDTTTVPSTWQSAPYVDVLVTGVDPNGSGIARVDWDLDGATGSFNGSSHTVRVTGDADHVLKTRVVDGGGEDSGWTTRHVKIDMVTPTDATTASGGWQRAPLDVAVAGTDALSGIEHVEWQLDGSATQTSTGNPHTVNISGDGVHDLESRVYDAAGNATGWKQTTVLIDATAPRNTTPTTGTAWRANNYTVTLSGDDDVSGLAQMNYKIDGGTTHSGPSGFTQATVSGNGSHVLQTWATDVAGNASAPRSETINIDTVAPTDTTTAPGAAVPNHYPVVINGTDADSGVVNVKWKIDGGPIQNGAPGSVATISGAGTHTLDTMVVDAVGNDSGWKSMTITVDMSLSPDTTAPTDTTTSTGSGWKTAPFVITVAADDGSGVGVDHVEWRLDGQPVQSGPSGSTVTATGDGEHDIETRAVDLVGNTSSWRAQSVFIDTAVPTDTTSLPTSGWASTRSFVLSGTDDTSGVATIQYQLDGGATQTTTNGGTVSFASDGSHTLRRRVLDAAGQASAWVLKTIKIDTVLPANTSAAAPTGWQNAAVSLPLTGTDALSGVDHAEWRVDGGAVHTGSPAVVSGDGVQLLETRIVDVAGNASAWRGETVKVDRTAPVNVTPAPASGWQNTSYTATVAGSDATSGVARVEWTLDGGAVSTTPSVSISASGAHTLVSRVIDVAGNASAWRTDSIGIDKIAPTLSVDCGSVDWRRTAATCSVSADGGASGLPVLTATRGSDPAVAIGGSFTVDTDGTSAVTFRAVDGAGNEKLALATVKIDRTPPSATVSCANGAGTSYVCTVTGSDGLSGLSTLTWSVNGSAGTAIVSGATFSVQKGTVTVTATDRAGNAATSAPLKLAERVAPPAGGGGTSTSKPAPTARSTSEAVLRVGKGTIAARALGELELVALPSSTTATLRPLALGKGRFQIVLKLTADKKTKTASKTIATKSGYSPQITLRLGGAVDVRVKLTVKRRSGSHWVTLANGSAKL